MDVSKHPWVPDDPRSKLDWPQSVPVPPSKTAQAAFAAPQTLTYEGRLSYWRNFSGEYRRHPISMTFGVVMSAIFFMLGVLTLLKIVKFFILPHDYLLGVIRLVELALWLFALFGVIGLCFDREKDRFRILPMMLGILMVMTLGAWAFDGKTPFCGWPVMCWSSILFGVYLAEHHWPT